MGICMLKKVKMSRQFVLFIVVILLILSIWNVILVTRTTAVNRAYQEVIGNVVQLNDADSQLNDSLEELELYLTTRTLRSNETLNRKIDQLYQIVNSMPEQYATQEEQLAYSNLRGLMISLSQRLDDTITAFRGRSPAEAIQQFNTVKLVSGEIEDVIHYLAFKYMSSSNEIYSYLLTESGSALGQSMMLWLLIMVLILLISAFFVHSFTDSLRLLTEQSTRIAEYPENAYPITVEGNNEIAALARSFNRMGDKIRQYILELKNKADIEHELRETEMKNLSMENMLSAAQLMALQSQINPHFLFNTLNSIAQLAMLEDADETYELILNVSKMLRYNLRNLEDPVLLSDEIENLQRYIYIQRVRYGDKIDFQIVVEDDSITRIQIPALTIQPIVENAVIHGFASGDVRRSAGSGTDADVYGGAAGSAGAEAAGSAGAGAAGGDERSMVRVRLYSDSDAYYIEIADNGEGMSGERLDLIRNNPTMPGRGHTTGIGVRNVKHRLQLFYGVNVFDIDSVRGEGTRILLTIPRCVSGMEAGQEVE